MQAPISTGKRSPSNLSKISATALRSRATTPSAPRSQTTYKKSESISRAGPSVRFHEKTSKRRRFLQPPGGVGFLFGEDIRQTEIRTRSEEHTSELQSQFHLVC